MNTYICRGRRRDFGPGLVQMVLEVNGVSWNYRCQVGNCHEATYRATELALRAARRSGLTNVTIQGNSPLVTKQLNRHWRTRSASLKKRAAVCHSIAQNMQVQYV